MRLSAGDNCCPTILKGAPTGPYHSKGDWFTLGSGSIAVGAAIGSSCSGCNSSLDMDLLLELVRIPLTLLTSDEGELFGLLADSSVSNSKTIGDLTPTIERGRIRRFCT